ncbi:MAG: helix-turn-helix transcriptional regulator [Pseudodonghicola sp.]|nr:helix-turn-helix transcriptional regulator [Pseudodonghicola sp.]
MTHPTDAHVGKKIRHFRWLKGLNQTQLAGTIGVKFQQLQKYETGANRISASRLFATAEALEQPVASFFPDSSCRIDQLPMSPQDADLLQSCKTLTPEQRKAFLGLVRSIPGIQEQP